MDWLDRYAEALAHGLDARTPAVEFGPGGMEGIFELARLVNYGTGTEQGPLACFLAGCYVALRVGEGADAPAALEEATRVARRLLEPRPSWRSLAAGAGADPPTGDPSTGRGRAEPRAAPAVPSPPAGATPRNGEGPGDVGPAKGASPSGG